MSGQEGEVIIDWSQILVVILGSAAVGALISAIVNYFLTMREFRKKREMDLIQSKLDLYSSIIYHLDKMKYHFDALSFLHTRIEREERYAFTEDEWEELVHDIDEKISDRYYLLNRKILEKWVWAKTLRVHPKSLEVMPELRKMLVEEYNCVIDKHLSKITDVVPRLEQDTTTRLSTQ